MSVEFAVVVLSLHSNLKNRFFVHIHFNREAKSFCIFLTVRVTIESTQNLVLFIDTIAKLITAQRNRAIGMLQAGMSSRTVARAFNSCHSTILRLWKLFQHKSDVSERPRTRCRGSRALHKTGKFSYVLINTCKFNP